MTTAMAIDAIRYAWEDRAAERDDSSVADLFASYDRCELLFRFSAERWLDDAPGLLASPWPQTSELAHHRQSAIRAEQSSATPSVSSARPGNRHPAVPPLTPYAAAACADHQPRARNHRQCLQLHILPATSRSI
jgi:hypothetical protein